MKILSACVFVVVSYSSAYSASEEFPAKFRGWWATSKEACDTLRTDDAAAIPEKEQWLKITATNVLGSTQGRFLREAPPQAANGVTQEQAFEMQPLDESGQMVRLVPSADGRLRTMNGTAGEPVSLLSCSSGVPANEQFPERMRGLWADDQTTCGLLRTKGPAFLREDQYWLKIAATDVLGSSQGRLLRERKPAQMVNTAPAELSFEIQLLDKLRANLEDLTLSFDGRLYETMVGARASSSYLRCETALPRSKNP